MSPLNVFVTELLIPQSAWTVCKHVTLYKTLFLALMIIFSVKAVSFPVFSSCLKLVKESLKYTRRRSYSGCKDYLWRLVLATGHNVEILKEVLPPAFILWPFVDMRRLCLYQENIFLRILRDTAMMIVIVTRFRTSAQISDGQSSLEWWEIRVRLTRAS